MRDSFIKEEIHFHLTKWWCDFIFHDLNLGTIASCFFFITGTRFDFLFSANLYTLGAIEFQCISSSSRLRVSEHNSDLHTYLIDKYDCRRGFPDDSSNLSECL